MYAGSVAAHAAARRALHECYTPCTHDTRCNHETGLCEASEGESGPDDDGDLPTPRTPFQMASAVAREHGGASATSPLSRAPAEVEPSSDYECDIDGVDRQTVHATSVDGARAVCLAWNDVVDDGETCTCVASSAP